MASKKRIREGFPNQRLVVLPANTINRCRSMPVVDQLYVTDIGSYPKAPYHYVKREPGIQQAIAIGCIDGFGQVTLDNSTHSITRGHLLFIPPNEPHVYEADHRDPWSIFWIHFDGHQTDAVLRTLGVDKSNPLVFIPDVNKIRSTFEDVYACLNYRYSDSGLLAMSGELFRFMSRVKLLRGFREPRHQYSEKKIDDTIEFMSQHLNMLIKLKDLAAHSGHSVSYFSKLFKERTGQAPMNYFIQLKVQKACELLDQTQLPVVEVAAQLGYEDPYYFSRLFKKIQGCSPMIYRNMVKG
ncbi:MAG: AraC family transcriptional regulator [Planctomycetota bacterium]